MDKETKRRVKITILGMLGLVALIIGISFAAFSADLAGVKVQSMNTGCLKVDMTDEGSLNIENAMPEPDESGLSSDPYTYTITNSCSVVAYFTTTLNVMNTSNLDNLSKVKVALEGDSYLEPTMISNLETGELLDDSVTGVSKTYVLDEGYLKVGESKTFELRTWIDYDVTSISGGLETKIIIGSIADNDAAIAYSKTTPAYTAINKNTILDKASIDYSKISPSSNQTSGVVEVKGNNGTTYHFRGNPNNYLKFSTDTDSSPLIWRILSTNSDGSINIVINSAKTVSELSNVWSTYNLDSYSTYINQNAKFCTENGNSNNQYYAKLKYEKHNPTGECPSNSYLTKIGLLTVDDMMFAGASYNTSNTSFFLADSSSYKVNGYSAANTWYAYSNGLVQGLSNASKTKFVITLDKDTKLEGQGTEASPFYVSGKYTNTTSDKTDKTAPIIDKVSVDARWSNQNKSIDISARDNTSGSGLGGYIVKTENTTPTLTESGWEAATSGKYQTANTFDNGTYYVFAKDNAGNISEGRKVIIEKVDKIAPTCTIKINPNGTTAPYKTLSIVSDDNYINKEGYSWSHNTNLKEDVIKVTENGSYTGYVTDLAGNKGSCTGVVTNVTQANAPVLDENMIPVFYDESSRMWIKADVTNSEVVWYDYDGGIWANSVTVSDANRSEYQKAEVGTEIPMDDILTMQVWIPRYKYKVWNYNADGNQGSDEQPIEIAWEEGIEKTGQISCTDSISVTEESSPSETCKLIATNEVCTDDTCNGKFYNHPAFTFGDEEIPGFWIGKFELTGTISNITTKPNLSSLRSQTVSAFETNIMKMKNSGNQYGFSTTTDTHMIKNLEWGAVAYLSHSEYGACLGGSCGDVAINSNSSYITGNGPDTSSDANEYNGDVGMYASTTQNTYGVYDMSGGAEEYVMGNLVGNDGKTMMSGTNSSYNSGYTGIIYDSGNYTSYTGIDYPNAKYYDKYSWGKPNELIRSKLGDGIKEVNNWPYDLSMAIISEPWFIRGLNYRGGDSQYNSGLFGTTNDSAGEADSNISTRLIFIPQSK